jgi:hypothetical protein
MRSWRVHPWEDGLCRRLSWGLNSLAVILLLKMDLQPRQRLCYRDRYLTHLSYPTSAVRGIRRIELARWLDMEDIRQLAVCVSNLRCGT